MVTTEAQVAMRLFSHIAEKDPAAVSGSDDAIAVFAKCLAAVTHRERPPRRKTLAELAMDGEVDLTEDDVPF